MRFTLNEDQQAVASALDKLAAAFDGRPTDHHDFVLPGTALEQELEASGYFDIANVPELGPVSAALAVERFAHLSCTAEIALSMLVLPHLSGDWERPVAAIENGQPGRFVENAKTLILIDGDNVAVAKNPGNAEALESLYAYPMAKLTSLPEATPLSSADAAQIRLWLRVAMACEMAGLIQAAIDSTVEHLSVRKQFGRPLGSFQALRHRMAECAVLAGGVRRLALKAAWSGDEGDAALAALHAQDSATRVIYDLHQFLGAMGMTLEHPLHLWTYRMKALLSELGGRGGQSLAVARHCFAA